MKQKTERSDRWYHQVALWPLNYIYFEHRQVSDYNVYPWRFKKKTRYFMLKNDIKSVESEHVEFWRYGFLNIKFLLNSTFFIWGK